MAMPLGDKLISVRLCSTGATPHSGIMTLRAGEWTPPLASCSTLESKYHTWLWVSWLQGYERGRTSPNHSSPVQWNGWGRDTIACSSPNIPDRKAGLVSWEQESWHCPLPPVALRRMSPSVPHLDITVDLALDVGVADEPEAKGVSAGKPFKTELPWVPPR